MAAVGFRCTPSSSEKNRLPHMGIIRRSRSIHLRSSIRRPTLCSIAAGGGGVPDWAMPNRIQKITGTFWLVGLGLEHMVTETSDFNVYTLIDWGCWREHWPSVELKIVEPHLLLAVVKAPWLTIVDRIAIPIPSCHPQDIEAVEFVDDERECFSVKVPKKSTCDFADIKHIRGCPIHFRHF